LKFSKGDFLMIKFFSKGSSVLAGALFLAGTTVSLSALSQVTVPAPVAPLLLIQGKVTAVQGTLLTVKTPDTRTSPAVIIAGPTFNVDISGATFQTASGKAMTPQPILVIGDSVVVAGPAGVSPALAVPAPAGPNKLIVASVVSRTAP
jgi:hypothetical protein